MDILHLYLLSTQVILVFLEDQEVHQALSVLAARVGQVVQESPLEHLLVLPLVLDNLFLLFVLVYH